MARTQRREPSLWGQSRIFLKLLKNPYKMEGYALEAENPNPPGRPVGPKEN